MFLLKWIKTDEGMTFCPCWLSDMCFGLFGLANMFSAELFSQAIFDEPDFLEFVCNNARAKLALSQSVQIQIDVDLSKCSREEGKD